VLMEPSKNVVLYNKLQLPTKNSVFPVYLSGTFTSIYDLVSWREKKSEKYCSAM
jgi:hypothetical protein